MRAALLVLLLGCGCAASHGISGDGGVDPDGGSPGADAGLDAASVEDAGPPSATACGPNVCRSGEVCCDPRCGVCAFAGECPAMFDCPGP